MLSISSRPECREKLKGQVNQRIVVGKPKIPQRGRGTTRKRQTATAPAPKPAEQTSNALTKPVTPNVDLTLKHFQRRRETNPSHNDGKRLYLRVGDEVNHRRYEEWGIGVVMECMTSSVPGGTCLVRVRFQDG